MAEEIRTLVERIYRAESRKVLATLIGKLGDFDRAEDALHEAFHAALEQWPLSGVPENPFAWLVSVGRFKGIDRLRKDRRTTVLDETLDVPETAPVDEPDSTLPDDRLRLIFTCCHPELSPEGRAALTLREVGGLTTEEIARAFLTAPAAMAQRIVRAKAKIKEEAIPYEIPGAAELPERLEPVLQVIYLVFNEGYSASSGESLTRADLSAEAIRLGRLLLDLLPETEVRGLLALMLFQESRRAARATSSGDLILLDHQDRSLWNLAQIEEATALVQIAFSSGLVGSYTLQAAIASVHAAALKPEATDWNQIVTLYDLLHKANPSPVVELNRAVAIAMRDGPQAGLALVDDLLARGELDGYHLVYSVRADLCRRLGKVKEAREAYQLALIKVGQGPERRFLQKRLAELDRFPSKNRGE